jgi:hypothetical protein
MALIEHLLEYPGWGLAWGRCHVITQDGVDKVVVGGPAGNPGTSVVNAIEQIADAIEKHIHPDTFELYEYLPWSVPTRRPSFQRVIFSPAESHKMPQWQDADPDNDPFLREALAAIKQYKPYELAQLSALRVVRA